MVSAYRGFSLQDASAAAWGGVYNVQFNLQRTTVTANMASHMARD